LLFVGQTPPPWHGQAVATQMLFEHDWEGFEVGRIRMAYSAEMEEIGRLRWHKVGHLLELVKQTRRWLLDHPDAILCYPPASPQWAPFLRDVLYLALTRHLAGRTVFIYHAGGLAEWVKRSWLRRLLARRVFHKADLSLEVAIEEPSPHTLFRAKRWKWSPYGIEVPRVERGPRAAGEPCRVLFVGSLQEGKGVLEVLKTAALLREQGQGAAFRFTLVGRWFSEEFENEARAKTRELGVEDMVEFPGQLTGGAKWQAYAAADVFFFPTHYASEAFPIVLIEGLGSGMPVVTTRWRGVPSLVEGCPAASLCAPRDSAGFATALRGWAERTAGEGAAAIAAGARDFYEERYLPRHFLGRIANQLELLKGGEPAAPPVALSPERPAGAAGRTRILQVFNQYLERGGEEIWVNEMLRLCQGEFEIHDLRFHSRAWKGRGAPNRLRQAILLWNNPDARQRLRDEVKRCRPDLLVFHNLIPVASLGLYAEARELGIPVLQFTHNFRPFSASGTLWFNGRIQDAALRGNPWPEIFHSAWEGSFLKTSLLAWYLWRLRRGDGLDAVKRWVTVSDFMRGKFIEAGIPEDKLVTLRHCWHARGATPPAAEDDYYLFLGRLVPEKGIAVLLDAWSELSARLGSACPRLIIAGSGPEEARVHRAIARKDRVSCVGFVDGEEKSQLLAGCRALIAPSIWWEPLGLIVYEAYEHSRPVLAARSGGLQETVQAGVTGLLHPPGDVGALVDDVLRLEAMGPDGRRSMGQAARRWLLEEAGPERWREEFRTILRGLATKHISPPSPTPVINSPTVSV
jgi:glycosyltransferase involved in cell wall biosynthesis